MGDLPGHPFRGNQWTASDSSALADRAKAGNERMDPNARRPGDRYPARYAREQTHRMITEGGKRDYAKQPLNHAERWLLHDMAGEKDAAAAARAAHEAGQNPGRERVAAPPKVEVKGGVTIKTWSGETQFRRAADVSPDTPRGVRVSRGDYHERRQLRGRLYRTGPNKDYIAGRR